MAKYLDETGLDKLVQLIKAADEAIRALINNKVDKVSGKGLSSNDYTSADKAKLDSVAQGAEVNVQSDWNQTDISADSYIHNKPTVLTIQDVRDEIAAQNGKIVVFHGSIPIRDLPAPSASNVGWMYNISDDFTTTANFVEGAGIEKFAGENVACAEVETNVYKWDCLGGGITIDSMTAAEVQAIWDSN